jgi:hypothetical protein
MVIDTCESISVLWFLNMAGLDTRLMCKLKCKLLILWCSYVLLSG